jgi:hypothetical protein
VSECGIKGGYAGMECVLEAEHGGDHMDFLERTWDEAGTAVVAPSIDPDKITVAIATGIAEDPINDRWDETGTVTIEGVEIDWWMGEENLWFYNSGDTGEDTIKRFMVDRTISVWAV